MTTTATRLVLMAGLPGSGKTTLSRELEARGFRRISPDERVWRMYGHYGRDFPRGEYRIRERPILEGIASELRTALESGHDVVMDHGFWTSMERGEWRRIGEEAGAIVTLVHLLASHDELWQRIKERNQQTFNDANAMYFSEDDLRRHGTRFEPPGEDEPHIIYTGSLDPVIRALAESGVPTSAHPLRPSRNAPADAREVRMSVKSQRADRGVASALDVQVGDLVLVVAWEGQRQDGSNFRVSEVHAAGWVHWFDSDAAYWYPVEDGTAYFTAAPLPAVVVKANARRLTRPCGGE